MVKGALKRLDMIRTMPELKENLWTIVNALQSGLKENGFDIGKTNTCVTPIFLNGEVPEAMALVHDLRENHGVFCSIVVYPVIPKGMMILRLIPTAAHTLKDVDESITAFKAIRERLEGGVYKKIGAAMIK
jgi:glycine C-acetyltransferase